MTNLTLIPYIINSTICFTTSIMLLTVKSYSEMGSKSFQRIKHMLACCGLIEAFLFTLTMLSIYYNIDRIYIAAFIKPILYYIQLAVITIGLLILVHSRKISAKVIWISFIPVFILTPIHIIAYLINSSGVFSLQSYIDFCYTKFTEVFFMITYVTIIAEVVLSIYFLITETKLYRHQLVTVFSGSDVINGRKLTYLVYGFLGYFALTIINIFISNSLANLIYVFFNAAIFLIGAIVLFNIQDSYSRAMIVEDYMVDDNEKNKPSDVQDMTEYRKINELIRLWEERSDKPYLKKGFTLLELANDIDVQTKPLLEYIKNVCNMNFNDWVDILRINEAIKIINENPNKDLYEVATSVGFRNEKSMSKAFVGLTGKAPETYKS